MEQKFNSVEDLLSSVSDDKEFNNAVKEEINTKRISKMLVTMRCQAGLNQKQVAEKMKVSQGKVSKLEHSYDNDISIGDLVNYCSAINISVEMGFYDQTMTIVDTVKLYFFRLKNNLDKLINLSKGDLEMERGVEKFVREAFFNINLGLIDCLKNVKPKKLKNEPLQIDAPPNLDELNQKSEFV